MISTPPPETPTQVTSKTIDAMSLNYDKNISEPSLQSDMNRESATSDDEI